MWVLGYSGRIRYCKSVTLITFPPAPPRQRDCEAVSDDYDEPPAKLCLNLDCTRKKPVKGNWCTAKACKEMRALGMAVKKQDTLHKACAAVGVPVPAALPADGGQLRKVALCVRLVVALVERAHKMNNAEGVAFIHRNSQD